MDNIKIETDQAPIHGTVENSNENILNNIENYLQYIRQEIQNILVDDNIKYSDPMEKKKIYPDFTYTQFLYLLSRLYDRVFSVNTELLCDNYINKYNKNYNIHKVELCYEVYYRLCLYYGYNCTMEPFFTMTGMDDKTVREWLRLGRSSLLNTMLKNAKNSTVARFENSRNPLLSLAAANYKYRLNEPTQERQQDAQIEALPDLLALVQEDQQELESPKN